MRYNKDHKSYVNIVNKMYDFMDRTYSNNYYRQETAFEVNRKTIKISLFYRFEERSERNHELMGE